MLPPIEEWSGDDYLEAEIDSTDNLVPYLNELFGENLLKKHFLLSNLENAVLPDSKSSDVDNNFRLENDLSLCSNKRKRQLNQNCIKSLKEKNFLENKKNVLHEKSPHNLKNPDYQQHVSIADVEPERISSIMSNTTFVLENDKRRPLLVPSGFDKAVCSLSLNNNTFNSQNVSLQSKINLISKPKNVQQHSLSSLLNKQSTKALEANIINTNLSKKLNIVKSTNKIALKNVKQHYKTSKSQEKNLLPTLLIEEKENTNKAILESEKNQTEPKEYIEVFASRPKINRTPEC